MVFLISRINSSDVCAVFRVEEIAISGISEFIILLKDSSYFCTCVLLQNKGIVCRHFFYLMQEDGRFMYHIRLVPRRWYTEDKQQDKNVDEDIKKEEFASAFTVRAFASKDVDVGKIPEDMYMGDMHKIYPPQPIIRPTTNQRTTKRRYAEAIGAFKRLAEKISTSNVTKEEFDEYIQRANDLSANKANRMRNGRNNLFGERNCEDISDGENAPVKGRPKKARLMASFESKRGGSRKSATKHPTKTFVRHSRTYEAATK